MKIFCKINRVFRFLGPAFLLLLLFNESIHACTIFNKTSGAIILVGNNEDWYKTNSQVMFYPGSEGTYGKMYFGFDEKGFGGMNECGLFLDKCALPQRAITFPEDKPFYPSNIWDSILDYWILRPKLNKKKLVKKSRKAIFCRSRCSMQVCKLNR